MATLYMVQPSSSLYLKSATRPQACILRPCIQSFEEEDKENYNRLEDKKEAKDHRPPFNLNLAVVLAGFAFEAYTTPPEKAGVHEIDAGDCETVFLSEHFLRDIYDGQLFVKLKKGVNLPAMDPWGTSDPYVVMQIGDCVVKSKTVWATKEPHWNESFRINVKDPSTKYLQIAVWDANLVTPHKRMGNVGIKLEPLGDGNKHEIQVELEGIGGGGLIYLEINYKDFEEINAEKSGWKIPFLSDIQLAKGLESALKTVFGTENVKVRDFVLSSFGKIEPLLDIGKFEKSQNLEGNLQNTQSFESMSTESFLNGKTEIHNEYEIETGDTFLQSVGDAGFSDQNESSKGKSSPGNKGTMKLTDSSISSEFDFWKNLSDNINQAVERAGINKVGFPSIENVRWSGNEIIKNLGLQSQTQADERYVESGLATPKLTIDDNNPITLPEVHESQFKLVDVKKTSHDILGQTESILGSLMMLTTSLTCHKGNGKKAEGKYRTSLGVETFPESPSSSKNALHSTAASLTNGRQEEMKRMFTTAESAMEAWTMLASALGCTSFIKSEFEKICFLDNRRTDTQVAVWRDTSQQRLVVAFRGTEQTRWKDLRTDLMLAPTGLNPERVGGDFKEEIQVHSGFLSAYDSVRNRLLSFIKTSIAFTDGEKDKASKWHVYVTGHSLGGALATLLSLELSSSEMAKHGCIDITMYNFGSPRVGNKRFADEYNKKVKDSWRIVNHRDIIPTVPRLMGYCHVDKPVYFTAGDLQDASVNTKILEDGYQVDVIGESTPDTLFSEFVCAF
ncbi:hypothetical protein SUGI_0454200 [Cryptomeria japonica]|nr:hypothetical protein SUGI_0454200 [Cryptomeria japonica]